MIFREAVEADIPQMVELRFSVRENVISEQLLNEGVLNHENLVEDITTKGKGWVCEIDGIVAGSTIGYKTGLIWALFVRPEYEGRGIGRRLLAMNLEWMREIGINRAFLDTAPKSRAASIYRQLGWVETGIIPPKGNMGFELKLG